MLAAAEVRTDKQMVGQFGIQPRTTARWRPRFIVFRLPETEEDAPRAGRKPRLLPECVKGVLARTLHTKLPGETHRSVRLVAQEVGVPPSTIHRIRQLHRLKHHLTPSFRLRHRPKLEEKVMDLVAV